MKAFTFQAPPNILFEAGASHKLAETVTACGVERVLLVTDKGVRNASLTKGAETSLAKNGCTLTVFDEVEADPPSHVKAHVKNPWHIFEHHFILRGGDVVPDITCL